VGGFVRLAILCVLAVTVASPVGKTATAGKQDSQVDVTKVDVFRDDRGVMVQINYSIENNGESSLFLPASNIPYAGLSVFDSKNVGILPYYSIQLYQFQAPDDWHLVANTPSDIRYTVADPIRIEPRTPRKGSWMLFQHILSTSAPNQQGFYLVGTHQIRATLFHSIEEWRAFQSQSEAVYRATLDHKPPPPTPIHPIDVRSAPFEIPAFGK
jgi:hypothetical protein